MDRNLPIKSETHKGDLSLNKTRSPKIRKGAWIKKETDRQTQIFSVGNVLTGPQLLLFGKMCNGCYATIRFVKGACDSTVGDKKRVEPVRAKKNKQTNKTC